MKRETIDSEVIVTSEVCLLQCESPKIGVLPVIYVS